MKKQRVKRALSLVLALAIVMGGLLCGAAPAKAAEETLAETDEWTAVTANEEFTLHFTLDQMADVAVLFLVNVPSDTTLCVYDSVGNRLDWEDNPLFLASSDYSEYSEGEGVYYSQETFRLPAGDYSYGITFSEDTYIAAGVYAALLDAKISQTKATITKGYTKTLSVSNATVKKWSSSKESVAAVNNKGKVTAKKAGKTTITAETTDGQTVTCIVTVKKNQYTESKLTVGEVPDGNCGMRAYKASFDSNGNLVIKVTFANNKPYKVTALKDVKIVVKNEKGKKVGTYAYEGRKTVSVEPRSTKNMTFTIKKSNLNKKKADLRNSSISCDGYFIAQIVN